MGRAEGAAVHLNTMQPRLSTRMVTVLVTQESYMLNRGFTQWYPGRNDVPLRFQTGCCRADRILRTTAGLRVIGV